MHKVTRVHLLFKKHEYKTINYHSFDFDIMHYLRRPSFCCFISPNLWIVDAS